MAQPQPQQQPQPQVPPRTFSPPQLSPSPATSQSGFALPPNKRPRTDGPVSQPGSPYAASPYTMSPVLAATPPTSTASPTYPQAQTPPVAAGYALPPHYANGHVAQGLALPSASPVMPSPALPPPQPPQTMVPIPVPPSPQSSSTMPQYTNATMQPMPHPAPPVAAQGPVIMGPPQKPAERPTKDYEYDVTDSLAGTGIDLRAEEQYMADLYSNALDSIPDARTGFAQHPPGGKASFYGAGVANQPGQPTDQTQAQFAAQAAEQAWADSSMRLAVQRTREISDPFLLVALLHRRAEKVAREHNLGLNLELKGNQATMGKMRLPEQVPQPKVTVKMQPGPDSTMVETNGSFIPHDAFLADQLALISIATKQRLRELLEDANVLAKTRQKTSHGDVPEEWLPAAAPMNAEVLEPMNTTAVDGEGVNGTEASETNPLKRERSSILSHHGLTVLTIYTGAADAASTKKQPPAKLPKISSTMTYTMRELARQEREWEEARLRRRQRRKDGTADAGTSGSRAGSAAPGTPGSVAPESEKSMTKKEMKKNQAMKAAEASSHANQNITSSMFAGLGGKGSLFGKKKSGKTYDWMNVGRGGSGASTPSRSTPGLGKGPSGSHGTPASTNLAMTTEGRNRLGTWREDKEKGKNIQLRDWVMVLERDGREAKALQRAYLDLDTSGPK
ncbi:hypothetical protein ESCO_006851 [Escovopsis weberi]|uniref:Transcription initiation factor TFIID subunit 4 n=1 Tax=Escovopsis weberi TaxID=150374 RepID=A0A0N0RTP5_ESCWE|nr:hypothetical protein ESCO_006851 [Escovopsis weberi]